MITTAILAQAGGGSSVTPKLPSSALPNPETKASPLPESIGAGASTGTARTGAYERKAVEATLDQADNKLAEQGHALRFARDGDARQLIVRLVDTATQKVLSQYPSDEALRAARLVLSDKPLFRSEA